MFAFKTPAVALAALALPVLSCAASEPLAVTNTIDVTAGGVLAEPVQLHRQVYADWLADPDYNSWTNYTDGGVHHEFPQITKLVWDTAANAIHLQNLYPGRTYEWAVTNNGTVVKSGSFTTAANPPRWLIATVSGDRNISNFRDLGGWEIPGGNGRRTNFDVFFRSANFDAYFESGDKRDRTGYIAFLLEGLCGLREEQLYRDHLSIVFAAQGAMWSERLDGNIRDLYTSREKDGSLSYIRYGDSLAGHIRAYLESLGVTPEEIATITRAYTGETPDEVLARVEAFEAANVTYTPPAPLPAEPT